MKKRLHMAGNGRESEAQCGETRGEDRFLFIRDTLESGKKV